MGSKACMPRRVSTGFEAELAGEAEKKQLITNN